jgi:hypothetical protein
LGRVVTPRSGADCIPVATRRGTTQSRESHPYGVPLLTAALEINFALKSPMLLQPLAELVHSQWL